MLSLHYLFGCHRGSPPNHHMVDNTTHSLPIFHPLMFFSSIDLFLCQPLSSMYLIKFVPCSSSHLSTRNEIIEFGSLNSSDWQKKLNCFYRSNDLHHLLHLRHYFLLPQFFYFFKIYFFLSYLMDNIGKIKIHKYKLNSNNNNITDSVTTIPWQINAKVDISMPSYPTKRIQFIQSGESLVSFFFLFFFCWQRNKLSFSLEEEEEKNYLSDKP